MGARAATGTVEKLKNSIRIKFRWNGQRCAETLEIPPTPRNIKAADELLINIVAEIKIGKFDYARHFPNSPRAAGQPKSETKTFAAFAEEWLATATVSKGTKKKYIDALKVWGRTFGAMPLTDVKHMKIKAIIAERYDDGQGVSGKTLNNDLIPLRHMLAAAVLDGQITVSPAAGIKNLKHQKPLIDPFTVEEMELILAYLRDHAPVEVWAYYEFAFLTGLRPSEQIIVRWSKVDWRRATLRIDTARTYAQEKGTKTSTVREIDLTPRAMAVLTRMKPFTFMKGEETPIFQNPATGAPWNDAEYQRTTWFHPALRKLGIRKRDAYATRHTFATIALMGGANPAYISRQMGHKNAKMLFEVYAKWIDGADKGRERAKLEAAFGPVGPQLVQNGEKSQ